MLKSTTLQIEERKLENQINEPRYLEIRSDDPDAETRATERTALVEELSAKRLEIIEAYQEEARDAEIAMAKRVDTDGLTSEQREFRDLGQKTSFEVYVQAGARERHVPAGSPEAEYNKHVFGGDASRGEFPIEMLLDRDEELDLEAQQVEEMRTVLTGVVGTAGMPTFVDRLFATSDGAYVGATYPAVGPGRHSFPVVSGTGVAAEYARDGDETPAGGLTVTNADPTRIQHSYEIARSDELQMPGIGMALQRDLRMSLMAGLDNKVVDDLISGLTRVNDTAVLTLTKFLQKLGQAVDGRGARDIRQVRTLIATSQDGTHPTSYGLLSGLSISNIGHFYNMINHDQVRGSMHIASRGRQEKRQDSIFYRTGAMGLRRLIVPVWRTAELMRDTGRLQTRGQITLTGALYADVIVANSDLHVLNEITTAA